MAKKIAACFLALIMVACLGAITGSASADDSEIIKVTYDAKGGIPGAPGGGEEDDGGYEILGKGVKWDLADYPGGVSYEINATGAPSGARTEIIAAFEEWDINTGADLFNDTVGTTSRSGVHLDGYNTVSWASITDNGVIAQCSFWYSRSKKEMVEFDIVFNTALNWGIDADGEGTEYSLNDAFDVRNIATHEIGHTLILLDLYEDIYSEMTMYGYGSLGETRKISLEDGDIAGLQKLYGA